MRTEDDDADWSALGLPGEMQGQSREPPKSIKARVKLKPGFVIVPAAWVEVLREAPSVATIEVAHELLLRWRICSHNGRIGLGNRKLRCDRWQKYRALKWLESRNLILVDRELCKSPRVKLFGVD
jgi:hypothetical protein